MSVCFLRGRFFKHLAYTTVFSIRHIHRRTRPPTSLTSPFTHFSALSSAPTQALPQWRLTSIPATFSTSSSPEIPLLFTPPYISVSIHCPKDVADMFSESLLCFGASSTSMDEQDIYEHNAEVCISSIFFNCQDVDECISHAADSIGLKEIPRYEVIMGDHSDWIKKTQESFQPVEVTEGLWIVPEWRTPPDLQATNIILNPGLAFGTGEHPTTKLCLLLLHGLIKGGELFLDYGTGSGILAIAALKAITSARQNATLNHIEPEKMQLHLVPNKPSPPLTNELLCRGVEGPNPCGTGVITETGKYDVVIANILLNPLLDLADHIVSYAKPGAVVGVSGIISEQIPFIMERYSQFLEGISVSTMDDWACVTGTKKRNLTVS
ncbi:uncharacterized protein LOC132307683 isoform X2 [Cornus florida]|uniref:uncharacterized protein LOC132307683 isoform X2 n=1 Tax=Cornus florida TaxID=4283 RepID=UPI00289E384B|nr:uncharacterized protein LOC132307683 isoform X2 [Cornus florida]